MNGLNQDLELIIYSYLQLEEILTIFKDNIVTRDKIIKLYHKKLPYINDAIIKGQLETVRYLVEYGIRIRESNIDLASAIGHLEIVKYLYEKGIRPTSYAINFASREGHLDVVKYLVENGIMPTENAIYWAGYAIDLASEYGHLNMVKYLFEKGVVPTNHAIKWAKINGYLEVVEYLKSIM